VSDYCIAVYVSVPNSVSVDENVAGGMTQVCVTISGGSAFTATTSIIGVTLDAAQSSPG